MWILIKLKKNFEGYSRRGIWNFGELWVKFEKTCAKFLEISSKNYQDWVKLRGNLGKWWENFSETLEKCSRNYEKICKN